MLPRSWALRFACRLVVLYAILITPWPGLRSGFRTTYKASATAMARLVGLGDYLAMGEPATFSEKGDVALIATNPQSGQLVRIEHGARDWGFLPLAAGLALVLGVPAPWPKRWKATAFVLAGISLFLLIRFAIAGTYGLAAVQSLNLSPKSLHSLGKIMMVICATPMASYTVPLILWLIVMYRYHDLSLLIGRPLISANEGSELR